MASAYENQPIQLISAYGTFKFDGAKVVDLALETDINEHPIEGYNLYFVHYDLAHKPRSFKIELTLHGKDHTESVEFEPGKWSNHNRGRIPDYEYLERNWRNKILVKLVCDFGSFENMAIKELTIRQNHESANTFSVEMNLFQIKLVAYLPENFQFVMDADGSIYGVGTSTSTGVDIAIKRPTRKSKDDRTWLEKGYDYLADRPAVKGLGDWLNL